MYCRKLFFEKVILVEARFERLTDALLVVVPPRRLLPGVLGLLELVVGLLLPGVPGLLLVVRTLQRLGNELAVALENLMDELGRLLDRFHQLLLRLR